MVSVGAMFKNLTFLLRFHIFHCFWCLGEDNGAGNNSFAEFKNSYYRKRGLE